MISLAKKYVLWRLYLKTWLYTLQIPITGVTLVIMKQLIAAIIVVTALAGAVLAPSLAYPTPAYAACSSAAVLGVVPWYRGLQSEETDKQGNKYCAVTIPKDGGLSKFVTMIALNILQAAFTIAAYVAIFFIIKGGFTYMLSAGSSDGMANAKKTITNAIIGLVIVLLSTAIINTIAGIL